ncbi:O-antigen ligase family protein [Microbacterium aureliae]
MGPTDARVAGRRARLADWWSGVWRWILVALAAAAVTYLLLDTRSGDNVATAVALAALVVAAVATYSTPMAMCLMAMPALFVVQRVSFGGLNLSMSDAALAAAFGTALLLGHRPYSDALRRLLVVNLIYQFATLFTVLVNPQVANTVEWFHAWMLISGALVVGWALGRGGHARTALVLMLAAAAVIGLGTVASGIIQYASGDFGPVYPQWPVPMHKNFAGTALALVVMIVYVNPPWADLPTRWVRLLFWLFIIAIVMTQARQAILGLIVAILIVVSRRGATGHSRAALLLIVPAAWVVVSLVVDQIESQNQHNSLFQRLDWLREVYAYSKHAPVFGHGLRFWYYDRTVPYQPPQAELEVVASSGLVGLAGFVAMWVGIIAILWRLNPAYGTLALTITVSRLVQGQFDLFWSAAQVSIPFVVAGICLGVLARDEDAKALGAAGAAKHPGQIWWRRGARAIA